MQSLLIRNKLQKKEGFTLVETLSAISIFVVITLIVFVGNNHFNNTILLTNLTYDIALTVARAQSYGVSVKQYGAGSESFNVGYGVHFRLCGTTAETNESDDVSFVLFADANRNQYYEKPSEFLERYIIRRGNKINNLYWLDSSGNASSLGAGGVDISFERPYPEAHFVFFDCSGNIISHNAQSVRVQVISLAGITKNINIGITGQISVQ
ncbi:MAG TPA: hypothetical protein VJC04_02080 [Candidatus Paceibacterota bacterium]